MQLQTVPYATQSHNVPGDGRRLLAQYDDTSIVVYQAFRPSIARFAVEHGFFGGEFSLRRMTWIKPNFLWMMSRSGWGTKPDQESTLAVRLRRDGFEEILRATVPSSWDRSRGTREQWEAELAASEVRLQWDPDHDPVGAILSRRVIQLGLRGRVLERYAKEWIVGIEDISAFVSEQRPNAARERWPALLVPREDPYVLADASVALRLGC